MKLLENSKIEFSRSISKKYCFNNFTQLKPILYPLDIIQFINPKLQNNPYMPKFFWKFLIHKSASV